MEMTTAAELYDAISLPALHMLSTALVIALVLPLAAVLGHAMGHAQRKRMIAGERELDQTTGKTSLGAILTLLGLLLAFSFGNSISVTQARKTATIQEAAALSTAFLRADYLGEPGRTELKVAILEYTKTRVMPGDEKLDTVEKVQLFLQTSLKSQAKLWPLTLQVTADPLPQPMKIFVAGAVNNALDAHLVRLQTLSTPISDYAQAMLLAAAITALFLLGSRSGSLGRELSWRTFILSGFLFLVMITIIDFQRGEEGFILTDQTALLATIFEMELALQ
jgi:hypothetical protein